MVVIIRKPYEQTERVVKRFTQPTRAKQAHKAECDINTILKGYQKTGLVTHLAKHGGRYADLPSNPDYQEAQNTLIAVQEAFNSLPSSVRKRFANDPAGFLAYVQDPANAEDLVKMGLATRSTPAEQMEPASPAPPAQEPA